VIKQEYPYHAGFSNVGFLYCDSYAGMVKFDSYNPAYVRIVGDKHPWALSEKEKRRVEAHLKPCPRGGRYRFGALPRCPICNEPLPNLLKDPISFVEVGEVVDGDKNDVWLEPDSEVDESRSPRA
jgi:hypothetical protein